jgi:hypothetical protein
MVRFDDHVQLGFETEQLPNGTVAVYLPGRQIHGVRQCGFRFE